MPAHRDRAVHRRVRHAARRSSRSSRSTRDDGTATTCERCARSAGKPEWNEMITVDTRPWGAHARRLRADRGDGHAHVQRARRRRSGSTAARRRWCRCASSTPTATRSPAARRARSCARGPAGDERLLEPARGERATAGRRLAPHQRSRPARGRRVDHASSGRRAGSIKSAAENIYPAEVEAALQPHPAVREAAVIGVPDATWAQSVKAIVVLHDGGDGDRGRAHRALPGADRVATRSRGRSSSYRPAAPRRLADRLRRPRRGVRRRRLPRRRVSGG